MNMHPLLLKPLEVGRLLGLGRTVVYKLMYSGVLPTVQLGKRRYVLATKLQALLNAGEEVSHESAVE